MGWNSWKASLGNGGLICALKDGLRDFPGGTIGEEPGCQWRRYEAQVQTLGREDPLEEGMATHSSVLA